MAELEQPLAHMLADLRLPAGANLHLTKFGMSDRQVLTQVTQPMAKWAVRIAGGVAPILDLRFSVRRNLSTRLRRTGGESLQSLVDL